MKEKGFKNTVCVVGLGYVGLPLALLADTKGFRVIGLDNDIKKIELIKKHKSPFVDAKIERLLKKSKIEATSDPSLIKEASIIIICVPTPVYDDHMPNLEPVKGASKSVASNMKKGSLVILESTVNPGVSEGVVLPILEEISGMRGGKDFFLAHCPERINPGDAKWDVENIPRVVGSLEEKGLKKAISFYKTVLEGSIKPMKTLMEAEACKVVENSFRDINIAFVNELAKSFTKLGIDVVNVIDGAATKPFAFMAHYPGCGVGGHCIPVDPYYLIEYAKKKGFEHEFLSVARRINNSMPIFTVDMLEEALNTDKRVIKNAKVTVLGLAYKANIGDDRESPSYEIVKELKHRGAKVETYDPFVLHKSTVKTLKEALKFAEAVVIATNHKVFKSLSQKIFKDNNINIVVDGKNCLNKESFIKSDVTYRGIGR